MTTPDPKIVASLLRQLADQFDPPYVPRTETVTMAAPKVEQQHVEVHRRPTPPRAILPDYAIEIFKAYTEDAPNWSGEPFIEEGGTAKVDHNQRHEEALVLFEITGLATIHREPAANGGRGTDRFLTFTEHGIEYAREVFSIDLS